MPIAQYLDDMILEREKANDALREELTKYVGWCQMLDQSQVGLSLICLCVGSYVGCLTENVGWHKVDLNSMFELQRS